jgi:amino acid adenylation domain-containing protein
MTIAQYLRSLRARGIEIERDGDTLRVDAPKGVATPALADEIRKRKSEILAFLAQAEEGREEQAASLVRRAERGRAPLSSAQERLFYLAQMDPDSCAYNVPIAFELRGCVDAPLLEQTLGEIVRRHDVLRSALRIEDGHTVAVVDPGAALPLPVVDLRERGESARAACDEALREAARVPFDLSRAPLLRATLFRLASDVQVLLVVFHHAVVDGRSHDRFEQEMVEIYQQLAIQGGISLPELELQYGDYAAWEQDAVAGEALAGSIAYWKQQLGGDLPVLEVATDRPRPPQLASDGATAEALYPAALGEALARIAREEAATPFMASLAAVVCALHRYTGQREIIIGTPVTNRWHPALEDAIGLFVNMAALRISLDPNKGYRELVRHVRDVCLAAYSHQRVPFERVVRELGLRRDPSRTPVFQCIFALEDEPAERTPPAEGAASWWVARRWPVHPGGARTDLSLWLRPSAQGLRAMLEYNATLFRPETAGRLLSSLGVLLEAALRSPEAPIDALPAIDDASVRTLLETWNDTSRRYPRDESLVEIFRRRVREAPDHPALEVAGDGARVAPSVLSYADLDRSSDHWAARIQSRGIAPGAFVALFMRRSPEFVVAVLATLKAGAAYVPVDPDYPLERQRFLLEDSHAAAVLTQPALRDALPATTAPVLEIDLSEATGASAELQDGPELRIDASAPAYVMYTSGSTGTPKGVVVPHRAIARLVLGSEFARLDASRVILQLAPISFDASTFEIWAALLHGARCVLHPGEGMPSPKELGEVLRRTGVTTLWLTASVFNLVIDEAPGELASVAEILTGGEALSPDHIRRALKLLPNTTLINGYGPTEGTTFTCCHRIPRDFDAAATSVPIGSPIANTRVYIVDARLQLVPIGACGEIVVGGDGLALGYWNRPELDRERFVPDPFGAERGGRLYRTGDFGRYTGENGVIEYVGRRDQQVKVRGFRIELGEIEAALLDIDGVEQAAVVHDSDPSQGSRLVAYVAPRGEATEATRLRALLQRRLPRPMLPALFEVLPRLPLSPNGKIDRARLPKPRGSEAGATSAAALTDVESRVVALWQEALRVADLRLEDDFFDRGGHSLMAVKLLSRINREFGTELLLRALIDEPTAAHCACLVEDARSQRPRTAADGKTLKYVVPIREGGTRPPLFIVHGAYGNVLNFRLMPQHLPHAIYGIQSKVAAGDLEAHPSVEAMAADYLTEIRRVQPHGPYVLGGFSGGGVVAYEMGRVLQARGETVTAILLLDTYPPVSNEAFAQAPERVQKHLEGLRGGGLRYLRERAVDRAQRSWTRWSTDLHLRFRGDLPLDLRQEYAFRTFMEASYDPQPSEVPCVLFRARGEVASSGITNPTRGWESLARGTLQVRDIDGDHHSMFVEPNVAELCREIERALAELEQTPR